MHYSVDYEGLSSSAGGDSIFVRNTYDSVSVIVHKLRIDYEAPKSIRDILVGLSLRFLQ